MTDKPMLTAPDYITFLRQFDAGQRVFLRASVLERDPDPDDLFYYTSAVNVFGYKHHTVAQLIDELSRFDPRDVLRFEAHVPTTGTFGDEEDELVVRQVVFDRFDDSRASLSHITTGHPSGRVVAVPLRLTLFLVEPVQETEGGVLVELTETPMLRR